MNNPISIYGDAPELLLNKLADPNLDINGVETLRAIIVETGSLDHLEALIETLTQEATLAIKDNRLAPAGVRILDDLIAIAIRRTI